MKKITLKITAFLFLALLSFQTQAQEATPFSGTTGVYKVKVVGEDLFLTINFTNGAFTYEAEKSGDDDTQKLVISAHPDGDHFAITSVVTQAGALQVVDVADAGSPLAFLGNAPGAATQEGAPVQQDKWNLGRNGGASWFLESDKTGTGYETLAAKRRVQTAEPNTPVILGGGGPVLFEYILLEAILSTKSFSADAFTISNPINSQLTIRGAVSKINKVNVYSILGSQVLTRNIDNQDNININVGSLASGLYIVELVGENRSLTKKIIKQ